MNPWPFVALALIGMTGELIAFLNWMEEERLVWRALTVLFGVSAAIGLGGFVVFLVDVVRELL